MPPHFDELETRSPEQRQADFIDAIRRQLIHARTHTRAYAELLKDCDCEGFSSLGDLARIPVTRKSELMARQKADPPLGGLAALEHKDIRYINVSPGPIYEPSGRGPDPWRLARALYAAGFRSGDLVLNCFSYHLTPAGFMLDGGLHALGCAVIPGGVGQTDMQARTIHDLQPAGYVGTPSFLNIILEKAEQDGMNTGSVSKALVSGEALPPALRGALAGRGVTVLQAYATADLGTIAYESVADAGLIIDEGVHVEIVRPGSGDPVPDGEVGEVVVTTLNPDYPLIRFATGDLSAIMDGTSDCGRTNRRIRGWMGRADQSAKVRGMFIHPEQVHEVARRHPQIGRARLVVERVEQRDEMTLRCECASGDETLQAAITDSIRDLCKVRGAVELVAPDTLPNDGIVIEDARPHD